VPALSQNLEFVVNGTTTTSVVYPITTTTAQTFISFPVKAANYYGINNALQTVDIKYTDFIGTITIQATLASAPVESDWFSVNLTSQDFGVDTTGLVTRAKKTEISHNVETTDTDLYNFEGNFIWLRAKINAFTQGIVNSISINY
jgi:hypothetical protein